MEQHPTRTAVIYVRKATRDGCSAKIDLPTLLVPSRAEANHRGAKIVKVFCDIGNNAVSGKPSNLHKMLDYLKANSANYVIVQHFYMLSQHPNEFLDIINAIERSGAKLISPSGEEEMLPEYRLMCCTMQQYMDKI